VLRFVTPAKERSAPPVPPVEPPGESPQQPTHAGHEIRLRGFQHEVKVLAHQAPGVELPARLAARFAQGVQESRAILVVALDRLGPDPAIHHMVNRPCILDAKRSGHGLGSYGQVTKVSIVSSDPFHARIYGTKTVLYDGRDSRQYLGLAELEVTAKRERKGAWRFAGEPCGRVLGLPAAGRRRQTARHGHAAPYVVQSQPPPSLSLGSVGDSPHT